jgi:hypothetical protein
LLETTERHPTIEQPKAPKSKIACNECTMTGKKDQTYSFELNVPFSIWADGSPNNQLIGDWEAEPEQLGWGIDSGDHDAQPNWEFDEPQENDEMTIISQQQREISNRIAEYEDQTTYVHRSHRLYDESAVLTQLGDNGDLIVDRYLEALKYMHANIDSKEPSRRAIGRHQYCLSTLAIAAAQDLAIAALVEGQATRRLPALTKNSRRS